MLEDLEQEGDRSRSPGGDGRRISATYVDNDGKNERTTPSQRRHHPCDGTTWALKRRARLSARTFDEPAARASVLHCKVTIGCRKAEPEGIEAELCRRFRSPSARESACGVVVTMIARCLVGHLWDEMVAARAPSCRSSPWSPVSTAGDRALPDAPGRHRGRNARRRLVASARHWVAALELWGSVLRIADMRGNCPRTRDWQRSVDPIIPGASRRPRSPAATAPCGARAADVAAAQPGDLAD